MRIIRFTSGGAVHLGQATDDRLAAADVLRLHGATLFDGFDVTDERLPVERLLAPVVPVDILCIGLNYRDHAAETGAAVPANPMLFIKASNTLNDPGAPIRLPRLSDRVDYEAELVVVIGRTAKDVSAADALSHVFGYTCGNDVSARDWQKDRDLGGGQFARGKSFDGFCPLGPCLVTADEVPDPQALSVRTTVNGVVMQDGTTADMIYPVARLIESLSSTMTLRPGQVILTGTPAGVADGRTPPPFLRDGDVVVVEVGRGRAAGEPGAAGWVTNPVEVASRSVDGPDSLRATMERVVGRGHPTVPPPWVFLRHAGVRSGAAFGRTGASLEIRSGADGYETTPGLPDGRSGWTPRPPTRMSLPANATTRAAAIAAAVRRMVDAGGKAREPSS